MNNKQNDNQLTAQQIEDAIDKRSNRRWLFGIGIFIVTLLLFAEFVMKMIKERLGIGIAILLVIIVPWLLWANYSNTRYIRRLKQQLKDERSKNTTATSS